MELKFWNGNHSNNVSFKRVDSKVKLGSLHFNNTKNLEARYELSDDIQVMDKFIVRNETHNEKDYLLDLKLDNMRLFIATEQGGGKMSENVMVIVFPKAKVAAMKWISTMCGREIQVKDKRK